MSGWGKTDALASKPKYEARKAFFDSSSATVVSTANDTIVLGNTSFATGDAVVYTKSGTNAVGGLTTATTYYVVRTSGNTIKLAATYADAVAGTPVVINLSALGDGTADTLQLLAADVYGVDKLEQEANKKELGHAHMGWVKVREVGSRKIAETLVAMSKNAITTDLEDVEFEDYLITITAQPVDSVETAGDPASFAVTANITGGGTITYLWQVSTDGGSTWASASGGVYSGGTTATLSISDNTGLDGYKYRVQLSATGADTVTSSVVTLTED